MPAASQHQGGLGMTNENKPFDAGNFSISGHMF
jgi:hypothetical protein